jgi:hypothetical protein
MFCTVLPSDLVWAPVRQGRCAQQAFSGWGSLAFTTFFRPDGCCFSLSLGSAYGLNAATLALSSDWPRQFRDHGGARSWRIRRSAPPHRAQRRVHRDFPDRTDLPNGSGSTGARRPISAGSGHRHRTAKATSGHWVCFRSPGERSEAHTPTPYPFPDEAIHVGKDFKIAPSSIICHVLHEPCPIGAVVLLEHRPDVAASTARILGVSGHARRFGFHIYTGHSHKEIE